MFVNPRGIDKDEEAQLTNLTPARAAWAARSRTTRRPAPDEAHTDGKVAAETIALLEKNKDRPFFIGAGFYRPHCPFIAPQEILRSLSARQDSALPTTRRRSADGSARARGSRRPPHWGVSEEGQRESDQAPITPRSRFSTRRSGRVLDALDRLKLADNTIVIFMSDHGYHLGERGQWMKQTLFERSARAPLIVAGPGVTAERPSSSRVVEFLDIYPTLADLARLPPPAGAARAFADAAVEEPARRVAASGADAGSARQRRAVRP